MSLRVAGRVDWLVRALLVLGLAAFAVFSIRETMGLVTRTADPELSHLLAPGDARISGLRSMTMVVADGTRSSAVALAQRALQRDATAVSAVTTLAIAAATRGDVRRAERLYGYAQNLSRRDLPTQIFLIENAVARGDVTGALRHYDIALRTSKSSRDLLFPVLASALAEPAVRRAAAIVIARRPIWGADFLATAAAEGANPQAVAALFADLQHRGVIVPRAAGDALMTRLVSLGDVATAWNYYRSIHPGAERAGVRNGRFDPRGAGISPFDWVLTNAEGIATSLDPAGDAGQLSIDLAPSAAGIVAGQMQILPPGRYRLSVRVGRMEGATPPLSWQLSCAGGERLATIDVARPGTFTAAFEVAPTCRQQWLRLFGVSGDGPSGASGSFETIAIEPVGTLPVAPA